MNNGRFEYNRLLTRIPRMLLPLGQILEDHALAICAFFIHVVQRGPAIAENMMITVPSITRIRCEKCAFNMGSSGGGDGLPQWPSIYAVNSNDRAYSSFLVILFFHSLFSGGIKCTHNVLRGHIRVYYLIKKWAPLTARSHQFVWRRQLPSQFLVCSSS